MSLLRPFIQAREVLGVGPSDDATAIKRAYRKLTLAHPPDTDPDGFRRIRGAYELLSEPHQNALSFLLKGDPYVSPPPLPEAGELPVTEPLAVALLRLVASQADSVLLLDPLPLASETSTSP